MAGTLAPPRGARLAAPLVRTLRPEDISALRLPGLRNGHSLCQSIARYPGRSVWIPETLEYALLAPWRNRPEIANVEELVAVRHVDVLLHAAFERCVDRGDELMLAIELESQPGSSRYERAGLEMLEEVITCEIDVSAASRASDRRLEIIIVDATDEDAVELVTGIDHAAFPWLWRNSRAEFDVYLRTPGVEVALVAVEGEPVAYFGATLYAGWGHLDRIAVTPNRQGHGYGRETLALAIDAMRRQGARRVALSTQRMNLRSQRLYERFGFRRTTELDYRLFGAWCRDKTAGRLNGKTASRSSLSNFSTSRLLDSSTS